MIESQVSYRESPAGEPASPLRLLLLGAFALGVVAGAAVAILFTPSTGRETRDAIAERVHAISQRIRAARRRMLLRMGAGGRTRALPAGVWPGTPSQAENGDDYESEGENGGEQS